MVKPLLIALASVAMASRALAGAGYCDSNPDLCPSFESKCAGAEDGEIHFTHPGSGSTYDGYCRNGLPDGEVSIHHANGNPSLSGTYANGKPDGIWKSYNAEDGTLRSETMHVDGRRTEVFVLLTKERRTWGYDGDGNLMVREVYKDGRLVQRFTYVYGDGETTMVEFEYSNGRWMKKSEKKYPQIEIGSGCAIC